MIPLNKCNRENENQTSNNSFNNKKNTVRKTHRFHISKLLTSFTVLFIVLTSLIAYGQKSIQCGDIIDYANKVPVNRDFPYNLWQGLYSYEEINYSGNITAISFPTASESNSIIENIKIFVLSTESTELNDNIWDLKEWSQVYEGSLSILEGKNWNKIIFDNPYPLSEKQNLIIAIQQGYQKVTGEFIGFGIYESKGKQCLVSSSEESFKYELADINVKPVIEFEFDQIYSDAGDDIYAPLNYKVVLGNSKLYKGVKTEVIFHWSPEELLEEYKTPNPIYKVVKDTKFKLTINDNESSSMDVIINNNINEISIKKNSKYYQDNNIETTFLGGEDNGKYKPSENYNIVVFPAKEDRKVILDFENMKLAENDWLRIYDGAYIEESNLIGEFRINKTPETITSKAANGALLINFFSNEKEDVGTWAIKVNTTTQNKQNNNFGLLQKKLNGGYYLMTNNKLRFKYPRGFYSSSETDLIYKLYSYGSSGEKVFKPISGSNPTHKIKSWDNYVELEFPFGSSGITNGNYIMEVSNNRNEKLYLRIKVDYIYDTDNSTL